MKKLLSIILTAIIFISLFNFNTSATTYNATLKNEVIISETTEYFEDGSSITTTITQIVSQNQTRATKTVSGSKTKTAKNSSGSVLYKFKVTGTFNVNIGVSATCTAVSCSASDLASGWSLDSSSTSKSGNTANATGIFKYKVLGITTRTQETKASLSCDANGTLS